MGLHRCVPSWTVSVLVFVNIKIVDSDEQRIAVEISFPFEKIQRKQLLFPICIKTIFIWKNTSVRMVYMFYNGWNGHWTDKISEDCASPSMKIANRQLTYYRTIWLALEHYPAYLKRGFGNEIFGWKSLYRDFSLRIKNLASKPVVVWRELTKMIRILFPKSTLTLNLGVTDMKQYNNQASINSLSDDI